MLYIIGIILLVFILIIIYSSWVAIKSESKYVQENTKIIVKSYINNAYPNLKTEKIGVYDLKNIFSNKPVGIVMG